MAAYSEMNGVELVRAYNEMAKTRTGQELGTKTVDRFSSIEVGIKRCEWLASSIKAREAGLAENDASDVDLFRRAKVKPASLRGKLLAEFINHQSEPLTLEALAKAIYGSDKQIAPARMVIRGLQDSIRKARLPYEIVSERKEGVTTYEFNAKAERG
jgi:hypothetical protein